MNVQVIGCKDECLKKELVRATHFFGRCLLSRQMLPHIDLEIIMKTTIPELGMCSVTFYNGWYKPRQFEIVLKRHKSFKNTIATLAHEMVHLKQFAKGELNINQTKWHKGLIDTQQIPYLQWPWEVEASLYENILYELYILKYKDELFN